MTVKTTYCLLMPLQNEAKQLPRIFNLLDVMNPKADYVVFQPNNSTDNTEPLIQAYAKKHTNVIILKSFNRESKEESDNIALARNRLLNKARLLDCDFTVFLDCDIQPLTIDFLSRLSSWKKDIIGSNISEEILNVDDNRQPIGKISFVDAIFGNPYSGHYRTNYLTNLLNEAFITGFSCVCLSRQIVQDKRLNFEPMKNLELGFFKSRYVNEDYSFCIRAQQCGYKVYVDGLTPFKHLRDLTQKRTFRTIDVLGEN